MKICLHIVPFSKKEYFLGFLVGHGIYLIGLSACDGRGNCGIANLTIHAVPGIALCKLETEPYVEYEMVFKLNVFKFTSFINFSFLNIHLF